MPTPNDRQWIYALSAAAAAAAAVRTVGQSIAARAAAGAGGGALNGPIYHSQTLIRLRPTAIAAPALSRLSKFAAFLTGPLDGTSSVDGRYVGFTLMWERSICGFRAGEAWGAQRAGFVRGTKGEITSKIKHAIKL